MLHTEKSENICRFFTWPDFIQLNCCIFLLKLHPFKNYSITFHIIAKHVDIYIVVRDRKCAISGDPIGWNGMAKQRNCGMYVIF